MKINLILTGSIKEVKRQIFDLIAYYGENAKLAEVIEYERSL